MQRKQFTFYHSFWETIQQLPTNKEKLQAFEMICDYALNETEPDLKSKKPSAATVFCAVKPTLERAHRRAKASMTSNNLSPVPQTDW